MIKFMHNLKKEIMKIYDILIIGAGPVGLYSTFLAGYMKLSCLCIELDEYVGGQPYKIYPSKYIYDFPGYEAISGKDLIDKLYTQTKKYHEYVSIKTNTKIISYKYLESEECFELIDSNNNLYKSKYILITSGNGSLKTNKLDENIINEHLDVHYVLKNLDLYHNKNIAILGAGDSAIDYSIHIKKNCKNANIHLIHHRNEISSKTQTIDDLINNNINLYLNHHIHKITKNHIHLKNGNKDILLEIDSILVQYGQKIDLSSNIFTDLEMINNKFKVFSEFYQSSNKNIYIAGTCVYNPTRINMIITGIGEATIALNHIKSRLKDTQKVFW